MATIRLIPSTYSVSNSSYLSVSNASNMYANTDSTTYATVTNNRTNSTSTYYLYIKGFNFDDVPSNATVNSFTVKFKAYESNLSTSTSYRPYLVNNTTSTGDYASTMPSTSTQTITFDNVSSSWETISGYGSNFGIRIAVRRNSTSGGGGPGGQSSSSYGYLYVYGAEILVDYTLPTYTVTSTITNGTITSTNPATVYEGEDATITFTGDEGYNFKSMTVNGTSVTPTIVVPSSDLPTMTYSTNYGIYNSHELSGVFDDDSSTFFWSNEVQAAGKYILINFDENINLSAFETNMTSSSTDAIASGTSLQVSSDGGSTWTTIGTFDGSANPTFSNLNQNNINAIRIYWNSGVDWWCCIDTISVTYTPVTTDSDSNTYTYTISGVTSDQTVIIIFGPDEAYYVKIDGTWYVINTIYKKVNNVWVEQDYELDSSLNYVCES